MTEEELTRMIAAEAARRRAADRHHIEALAAEMSADLDRWCAVRRRLSRAACTLLLLTAPAAYAAILPPRQEPPVVCNERGADSQVEACATEILTAR